MIGINRIITIMIIRSRILTNDSIPISIDMISGLTVTIIISSSRRLILLIL